MVFNWNLIVIMLGYAFFNGLGSFFYKQGLKSMDSESISFIELNKKNNWQKLGSLFTRPIWVFGLICLGIDFVIYQLALNQYEVSVVKPLVNLNLIFVYLFGFLILQEKIHLCEGFGLGCIIIGAVIISLKAEPSLTQVNLSALIHLSWITVAVIVFSFYVLKKNKVAFEFGGSMICGILYGLGSLYNKALYASGNSVLLKVIFLSLFGLSYFFAFLTGQTAYLKGRMSIVSTFVNIMSIVTPFIGGVILFGESFVLSSELVFFRWSKVLGLILIIIGIILNYPHQEDDSDA